MNTTIVYDVNDFMQANYSEDDIEEILKETNLSLQELSAEDIDEILKDESLGEEYLLKGVIADF